MPPLFSQQQTNLADIQTTARQKKDLPKSLGTLLLSNILFWLSLYYSAQNEEHGAQSDIIYLANRFIILKKKLTNNSSDCTKLILVFFTVKYKIFQ